MIGTCAQSRLIAVANSCPFIFGHDVIHDYKVIRTERSQLQPFAATGCGRDGIPEASEKSLFAFQHARVVVDTKQRDFWQRLSM